LLETLGTFILVCEVMYSGIQILAAKIGAVIHLCKGIHSLIQIIGWKHLNLHPGV
jgi:hypothetical protein